MLIALGCVTLIALAVLVYAYSQQRDHADERAQWVLERRELCSRIQAPERIPVTQEEAQLMVPEAEVDMAALVGTVQWDEPEDEG